MRGVPVVIWHLYAVSLVLASKDMAALPLITFHFIASVLLHLAAAALQHWQGTASTAKPCKALANFWIDVLHEMLHALIWDLISWP